MTTDVQLDLFDGAEGADAAEECCGCVNGQRCSCICHRKAEAGDWGVWVNECGIFASTIAADRWVDFQLRAKPERLAMLWMGPGGGEWHLMCGTKADATEARDLFIEVGFHKAHVRVARLSACQEKIAGSRARIDARVAEAVPGG